LENELPNIPWFSETNSNPVLQGENSRPVGNEIEGISFSFIIESLISLSKLSPNEALLSSHLNH
jgi:hypothetical protein